MTECLAQSPIVSAKEVLGKNLSKAKKWPKLHGTLWHNPSEGPVVSQSTLIFSHIIPYKFWEESAQCVFIWYWFVILKMITLYNSFFSPNILTWFHLVETRVMLGSDSHHSNHQGGKHTDSYKRYKLGLSLLNSNWLLKDERTWLWMTYPNEKHTRVFTKCL